MPRGGVVPPPPVAKFAPSPVPLPTEVTPAPVPTPSSTPPPSPSPAPIVITPTPPLPPPTEAPSIAAQAPELARLVVLVTPWAEVFVDGDRKGLTPFPALTLPQGSYVVELRHPDYRPFRRTVNLQPGELLRLSVELRLEAVRR